MSVESAPEIDFGNVQEDTDEISRYSYIDCSKCNFTDLCNFNNITVDQCISNSNNKIDSESNES